MPEKKQSSKKLSMILNRERPILSLELVKACKCIRNDDGTVKWSCDLCYNYP